MSVSASAGSIPSLSRRASVMEVPDVDDRAPPKMASPSTVADSTRGEADRAKNVARKKGADASVPSTTTGAKGSKGKGKKKATKNSAPDDLPDDIEVEVASVPSAVLTDSTSATAGRGWSLEVGHRNWAKGIREREILEPGMARFTEATRSGNHAAVRAFILSKTNQYIYQSGWRTSLKHQPETLPHWDDTMVLPEEPDLSEPEKRAKAWLMEQSAQRIERWYTYRYETTHGKRIKVRDANDPYSAVFSELAGVAPVKKALQGYQQYMRESYAPDIAHVVNERWPTEPNKPMNATAVPPAWFRAKIAHELYNNLPSETQDALKARAKEDAQREQASAIDNLPGAMHRLMQGIAETTGLQFVLLGGGPMPCYGGEIRTVHMSIGQNHAAVPTLFPQWKRAHFDKELLGHFKNYLETAYTPAERKAVALPDSWDLLDDPDLLSMNDGDMPSSASSSKRKAPSASMASSSKTADPNDSDTANHSDDPRPSKRRASSASTASSPKPATNDSDAANDSDEEEEETEEEARERRCAFAKWRDGNIARNKAMLEELDLRNATTRLMGQPAPAAKSARKPHQPRTAPTGTPRRSLWNANTGNVSEGTPWTSSPPRAKVLGSVMGEICTRTSCRMPASQTRQTTTMGWLSTISTVRSTTPRFHRRPPIDDVDMGMETEPASVLPECPADAATWLSKVYDELTGKDLGPAYHGLMRTFFELERAYGWVNSTGSFATDHQPKEWWSWWSVNQPDWREWVDGKPALGKEYKGGWEGLLVAGQNGMLNVVVSLYWWGCKEVAVKGHSSTGWTQAVKDAEWVMRGIREAVEADKYKEHTNWWGTSQEMASEWAEMKAKQKTRGGREQTCRAGNAGQGQQGNVKAEEVER
ncbi:hypothetical protein C8F01DRAFT_1087297 [Mycena amicta]|nr:hypothetical protein C8F01DRAFT_1087297 [Mycena amicta]